MSNENILGLSTWLRMAMENEPLEPFVEYLLDRANTNPEDASAILDLSYIAQLRGQKDWGMALQLEALKLQQVFPTGSYTHSSSLQVLALMMPGSINDLTAVDCLLAPFDADICYAFVGEDVDWMGVVPEHHILVNAIANRDAYEHYLLGISELMQDWLLPVINSPKQVLKIIPKNCAQTLSNVPAVSWLDLATVKPGNTITFQRVQSYIPKYRFVSVNGHFTLHSVTLHDSIDTLGLGYYETDMATNQQKQAVEQELFHGSTALLERFNGNLKDIHQAIGLDLMTLDCIPNENGTLSITLLDTACMIHAFEGVHTSPEHAKAHQTILTAFYNLLLSKRG